MLVLHYTGMRTAQEAIDRLRDPVAKVSSHYVVDEDGTVFQLVPEELRAFHAGISYWRGRRVLNDASIGIEIVNPGHEWGYRPFPEAQMAAVQALCLGILSRHAIPAHNVVGHSDIAPDRKQDPGELFDWRRLASAGIGLWPDNNHSGEIDPSDERSIWAALNAVGYEMLTADSLTDPLGTMIRAFQRHWAPAAITGMPDRHTVARLSAMAQLNSLPGTDADDDPLYRAALAAERDQALHTDVAAWDITVGDGLT